MTLEVIGAGFGRTGTLSLKYALEKLGFDKCYHMMELSEHPQHADAWAKADAGENIDWDGLFAGYKAAVDWPSCNFWRQQTAHFPEAKVILSLRDPEKWYDSIMNTIYPGTLRAMNSDDPQGKAFGSWANRIIWSGYSTERWRIAPTLSMFSIATTKQFKTKFRQSACLCLKPNRAGRRFVRFSAFRSRTKIIHEQTRQRISRKIEACRTADTVNANTTHANGAASEQHQFLRGNYFAMLAHGLLGQTGFRLIMAPTFVPAYIFLLSGSELLLALP